MEYETKEKIMKSNLGEIEKYLDLISERLWDGREYGRASVMIGAGFSRNAKKRSPQTKDFPLLDDLSSLMYEKLYAKDNEEKNIDSLSIASEFEAKFGKKELDEFIIQNMPDNEYLPSDLHKYLLSLPWSDVFTTNYDTLLERTLESIYHRKYELILKQEDIAITKKPRIVKLHGTIPSPFIITEEDYRTYPQKFAPFVNLVQESLMENIFCLIGFSANDSNFTKWISWVKDNLGDSMPKLYLIGILDISESQKRVFENKNIIPLDLSEIFLKEEYPLYNERYYKAIEWFLQYLTNGRPNDSLSWPSIKKIPFSLNFKKDLSKTNENDEILKSPSDKKLVFPSSTDKNKIKEELLQIKEQWKKERERYPGWIVLPQDKIEEIWTYTKFWLNEIFEYIDQIEKSEYIHLLYELNWRLEKCMVPLFLDWIEIYIKVIKLFNPFPKIINIESEFSPIKNPEMNWEEISEQWVELVFAVIRESRESRENLDEERFNKWIELIKDIVHNNPDWESRWHYEKVMFNFCKIDITKVKELIKAWPENIDCPKWELKRASILAEIGEIEKAEEIAEKVLNKIRSSLQHTIKEDFHLLSLEGCAIMLLDIIKQGQLNTEKETILLRENYRFRLKELRQYECNPWDTFKSLKSKIFTDELPLKQESEKKKKFDPGEEYVSYYLEGELEVVLTAFQFLRIFEEGAIPFRCGFIEMEVKEISKASKWIESFAPLWALSSFIRTGQDDDDIVNKWFDRLSVVSFSDEDVKKISSILLPAWNQSFENISKSRITLDETNIYHRIFRILTELISRFLFRLDKDSINNIYETLIYSYKNNNIMYPSNFLLKYEKAIKNLLKRLFYVLSEEDILSRISELLSITIPDEGLKTPNIDFQDPMNFIEWFYTKSLPKDFDRSSWDEPISKLIKIIKESDLKARNIAIIRLIKLINIKALTKDEEKSFAEALWSRLNSKTGLPEANLFNFAYIKLHEPEKGRAEILLKKWLLESSIPENFGSWPNYELYDYLKSLISSSKPLLKSLKLSDDQYIKWTNEELVIILKKLNTWVNKLVEHFRSHYFIEWEKDNKNKYSSYFLDILNLVIYPNTKAEDSKGLDIISSLIKESLDKFSAIDFPILSALPGTLIYSKENINEIEEKLKKGLVSSKPEVVRSSIDGIFYWLTYNQTIENFPKLNQELLNEIINKVLARRQPELDYAIGTLYYIIENYPNLITEKYASDLCSALEFLYEETEIPKSKDLYKIYLPFDMKDIPKYRRLASHLAFVLKKWYKDKEYESPEILMKWEERSRNDRLPEIWKLWKNN